MAIELEIPEVGESIREVVLGRWLRAEGDTVEEGDALVEIETDKISFDLPAPVRGIVTRILRQEGEEAKVGEVVGFMEEGTTVAEGPERETPVSASDKAPEDGTTGRTAREPHVMPSARRVIEEAGIDAGAVEGTGPGGRILKEDALRAKSSVSGPGTDAVPEAGGDAGARPLGLEEVVPMSPLRKRIAERLVSAQQAAALLTTFNEIDMSEVVASRRKHRDAFLARHGVKLGFMSFFVKAAVDALRLVPQVNAEIRDDAIVYKNHYDIGVAVGGGRGLVVPVVRGADRLSFAEVEKTIADLASRARENRLELHDLSGGTFTISNGGIYGSMLSTPIVNPPQSGILGLHAIQERPVGREGEIVLRPMMYVALTYDHRVVDGREAVTFLLRIKECVEDPERMLLEI